MKKLLMMAMAMAIIFPFLAFGDSEGYYSGSYARISYVKGDVYIQRGQDLGYEQGEVNLVVVKGDKMGTKNGRVEIQLGRRNYLRLDQYTQIDVVNLPANDADPTKLHLLSGSIYLRINTLDGEKNFEVHTPDASFYIREDGLYRIDVRENRETEFSAYSGSAEAAGESGSAVVRDREMVTASNGRLTSEPVSLSARRDEFSNWNESRDAIYARRPNRSYLPSEYADYEYELADYGRWEYESAYGNVWVPTVSYSDWRPYYYGRWAWYPIIGWTWVSSEPWGWCTSHYGRWGWRFGLGWYWIPHHYWSWGPAWVNWYWDYDYVGWCPLTYYNYPAVVINNIFYDHYSSGYFPNNSRTLTVINRNQLQNRRISQVALGEGTINRLGRISLRSDQPDIRANISRNDDITRQAIRTLDRQSLRGVNRSFGSSGTRSLSSGDLKSSAPNRIRESDGSQSRMMLNDKNNELNSTRTIRSRGNADESSARIRDFSTSRTSEKSGENSSSRMRSSTMPRNEEGSARSSQSIREFQRGSEVRSNFSLRSGGEDRSSASSRSSNSQEKSGNSGRRITSPSDSSVRAPEGRSSLREFQPRSSERSTNQSGSYNSSIRERSSSVSGSSSSSPRRSIPRENNNSVREFLSNFGSRSSSSSSRSTGSSGRSSSRENIPSYSRSSRSYDSSSRSYSAPSRSTSTPSRSSSAPSRSYSAPSRSYSSPSRNYSAPSRSYSSPSRSYSSPSYSSPSRSNSAPSRSYRAPSRSYSSPSRSYSSPSRSYSSPSRSSSSSSSYSRSSSGSSSRSSSGSSSGRSRHRS